jgi:hypothetical protein
MALKVIHRKHSGVYRLAYTLVKKMKQLFYEFAERVDAGVMDSMTFAGGNSSASNNDLPWMPALLELEYMIKRGK